MGPAFFHGHCRDSWRRVRPRGAKNCHHVQLSCCSQLCFAFSTRKELQKYHDHLCCFPHSYGRGIQSFVVPSALHYAAITKTAFRIPLRDTTTITDYMVQRPTFGSAIPFKNMHAYPCRCQTNMHVETSSRSKHAAAAAATSDGHRRRARPGGRPTRRGSALPIKKNLSVA